MVYADDLAAVTSLAISVARSHEDEERRTEHLHAALTTREVIGQAQGILMERERISAAQAFDDLRRASQYLNRKLRDVAQDLVDTGTRPETPGAPEGWALDHPDASGRPRARRLVVTVSCAGRRLPNRERT